MTAPASLEFFFEFASTYSYPAMARVGALATTAGVAVHFTPFLLGPLFADVGWNDSPFNVYPAKGRYMWRDLERICAAEGLAFERPTTFPRNGLLAARVATAADDSWRAEFARAVYRANFAEDRDIGDKVVIEMILRGLGKDATTVIAAAESAENKAALRRQTERARELGIFGAPSFVVGGELFWGNDRLEAAIAWALRARTE